MTVHSVESTINITTTPIITGLLETEMDVERFLKSHHVDPGDYVLIFERSE